MTGENGIAYFESLICPSRFRGDFLLAFTEFDHFFNGFNGYC